ncbi:ABC transporter substrate-binding protein [Georgenia faecalis]|uniref:ABC transporter substrate-binding protein n=1 Tax=Georgenia faecalis TaxID=2483799 RepID=A0ABV9D9Z4_9MICO|nr:extracellular solute-binding protein [Georgenia faecalis]
MILTRRRTTRLAAVLAGTIALAACAPSDGSGSDPGTTTETGTGGGGGEDVTLTFWSWRTEDVEGYEQIFDLYEEANPGVTVEVEAFVNTEYNTVLSTGLAGEAGPDIAQLRASRADLTPLVAAERLVPVDAENVPSLADFDATVLAGAQVADDENVYGVPFAMQTLQMFYNKDLFAEHGIEVPETWEDFLAANETLEAAGVIPMATTGMDNWMLPVDLAVIGGSYWAAGPLSESLADGSATLADEGFVDSIAALQSVTEFFPDNFTGVSYTESQVLFATGQAAMFPGGSWELGYFQSTAPDLSVGVFTVPPPPGAPGPAVPAFVDGSFGVNAASEHQEEALALLDWMGSQEFGQAFADTLKQITPISGVEPSDEGLAEIIANYEASPGVHLPVSTFSGGDPDTQVALATGLQEMFAGTGDPASVAQTYADAVAEVYPDGP